MSDAAIAAALAATPPAPPTTPAEAATRLDQAKQDSKWTEGFLGGNPDRVREFHDWHALAAKGDSVDLAMAGRYMDGMNTSEHISQMHAAATFRELGIRDEIIRDVLTDKHTVTQAEYNATKLWKEDRFNDKEFVAKLMGGDREARRKMTLANIILTGGIREEKAS